jgi:hypothetical protein
VCAMNLKCVWNFIIVLYVRWRGRRNCKNANKVLCHFCEFTMPAYKVCVFAWKWHTRRYYRNQSCIRLLISNSKQIYVVMQTIYIQLKLISFPSHPYHSLFLLTSNTCDVLIHAVIVKSFFLLHFSTCVYNA